MAEIDTSSWKEFRLDKLFEKIKTGKIQGKANDFPTQKDEEHTIPLLTAGAENQGLTRYAVRNDCPTILKNVISISANGANTGITFYQDNEFAVLQDAYAIKLKNMEIPNEQVGLFLASCVNKILYGNFSWTYKAGWERVKGMSICLPVTSSGEIDWKYMQERIAELEQERIAELEHYLVASGLNDYELTEDDKSILATELFNGDDATELPSENSCRKEARKFRVGDLFEKVNPRFYGKPNTYIGRKSCTTTEPDATHTIPLTCAKHDNNGVMYYGNSNLFESVANCLVMIRDGAVSTGLVFAHEDPVGVLSHSYLMKCKDDVSFRSLLYVSSVMTKTLYPRYNRSDPSYWDGKVENDRILLPVTYDGLPDWSFMEKYIRAVEKVVIKDVVDWKDEEIKKAKELVS